MERKISFISLFLLMAGISMAIIYVLTLKDSFIFFFALFMFGFLIIELFPNEEYSEQEIKDKTDLILLRKGKLSDYVTGVK